MHTVRSGCKINLLLNILCRRDDGFHELETVMQPIGLFDELSFERGNHTGIELSCSHPQVPLGPENLVCRAARLFQETIGDADGLRIHLEKNLPVAAGVGGGSGNAAATFLALNALYDQPLEHRVLESLAANLGSDIPFFLQSGPGIATGRGEKIERLARFSMFDEACVVLVNPGFGVSTPWAYKNLRLDETEVEPSIPIDSFVDALKKGDWERVIEGMYNSLEQPVFKKYPVLKIIQSELVNAGADGALLSGSGATVFAIVRDRQLGEAVRQRFLSSYGSQCWSQVVPLAVE
jgi:4-diphosphocytidyl-2-C-methyl-D-erythritol kinase